jgi:cathepsin K
MKLKYHEYKKHISASTGKNIVILLLGVCATVFTSCEIEPANLSLPEDEDIIVDTGSPKSCGLIEGTSCLGGVILPFDLSVLPVSYPNQHDLSNLMPPVATQGNIGSCTAWATTYYLKSYQEKTQNHTEYSGATIMSPSFVYNQTKASSDCDAGACLIGSLEHLRTKGAVPVSVFPYSTSACSLLPTVDQVSQGQANKIASYHELKLTDSGEEDELIILAKKLLYDGKPIVIGMQLDKKFTGTIPRNEDNVYIYKEYDPEIHYGSHAMLIVGYDDGLKAFKTVNSWGNLWGNGGYCWISYDFFKKHSSPAYQDGLSQAWFTVDE